MPTPLSVLEAIADARRANDELQSFVGENQEVIDQFKAMLKEVDLRLDAAKALIVANSDKITESNIEGFRISYDTVIDIEGLLEHCPELAEETKLSMPKSVYDKYVKSGVISPEVQKLVEGKKETPKINKPKW